MADTDNTSPESPETSSNTSPAEQQLGDAGKAALDVERKARREAEKQLKALQDQVKGFEDANKSELQKALDRADAAEKAAQAATERYTQTTIRAAVTDAAVAASAIDPATIHALIRDGISLDDDGNPVGIDKAIADLKSAKPFLFNATPGARDANACSATSLNDADALSRAVMSAVGL